ncbi:hypothetical protein SK128_017814 [Halocaridina rubra]|uniref:1-phosphatidylinositol-3-phosphate 5-kinase n=1 Tax=Halocaridina rubra TaxID=373956 RepID=A0AAN8X267_HALRR
MTEVDYREILQAIRGHDASNSLPRPGGWQEEEDAHVNKEELLIRQRLNTMWGSHETALLYQLLDSGGLSSSWADTILPIVRTVVDIIRPDVKNDSDDMDIRQYVQFKKVPGGSRSECQILNGAVCSKNVADRSMLNRLVDPQILLVASTIDYQRGNDNKLLTLDNLLLQEADYLKNVVAKILSYKPDVILVEKSIAFLARAYLQAHGIILVMNVKPSVMERVARCTQAEIVSSIDAQLKKPTLGMCHNFYVRSYPMHGREKTKTLMFFDGCATHLGCTVILRGASNGELSRVKKIMYFMMYAVYNWKLESSFLMDEYILIPPLPSESFELEDQVFESQQDLKKKKQMDQETTTLMSFSDEPETGKNILESSKNSIDRDNESVSSSSSEQVNKSKSPKIDSQRDTVSVSGESTISTPGTLDKTKLSQTISDFSDPLHSYLNAGASPQEVPRESSLACLSLTEVAVNSTFRKALDETILSCSPYLKYNVPYLETEAGRNCILRKYFQKNLYFSVQLEKEAVLRRPRFSEVEVKDTKDENQNVRIKSPHKFIRCKLTKEASSIEVQSMLADFRARGGQMRNVCKCESLSNAVRESSLERTESHSHVVVEGLSNDVNAPSTNYSSINNSKSTYNTSLWNGAGLMRTSEGKVEALHPFNHQRLSVLFSSFTEASETPPTFCVQPWVLTMDFYARNDIPLGAFLERYCFSSSYQCPSSDCQVAGVNHIRKFVHDSGCVDVLLRRLDTVLDDTNAAAILMWSWCKLCRQVTPVVPVTLETYSLSFAKYLELRFHAGSFTHRGDPSCPHSLHHDHLQYFGYKNQVAVFE